MTISAAARSASALAVADRCRDAFSADRYVSWSQVALVLLQAGFSEREAEAIMRSKITRWAADEANLNDGVAASAVTAFLAKYPKQVAPRALAALVAETFE